jgi:hypothetical protein
MNSWGNSTSPTLVNGLFLSCAVTKPLIIMTNYDSWPVWRPHWFQFIIAPFEETFHRTSSCLAYESLWNLRYVWVCGHGPATHIIFHLAGSSSLAFSILEFAEMHLPVSHDAGNSVPTHAQKEPAISSRVFKWFFNLLTHNSRNFVNSRLGGLRNINFTLNFDSEREICSQNMNFHRSSLWIQN